MADWSHPLLTDPYADVLTTHLNGRDVDAITLQKTTVGNPPNGAMAYDRSFDLFKEWNGTIFVNKKLSISGGGTGADNPTQARSNLGLGSMATQNSNAVSITGGSISGITLDGSAIVSGIVALARGGTGSSLTVPPFGYFLGSDGASVFFHTNGQSLVNLNASALAFGTVPLARLPSNIGKIAQVVYNTTNASLNLTNVYVAVTGHFVTITTTTSTSRIRINFMFRVFVAGNAGINTNVSCRVKRDGTVIHTQSDMSITSAEPNVLAWLQYLDILDAPGSISTFTYQLEATLPSAGTSSFASIGGPGDPVNSTIFATEII